MPPFRNPFGRKPGPTTTSTTTNPLSDESDPTTSLHAPSSTALDNRSTSTTSRTSSALSIKPAKETNEFKLSIVNDSGIYLPPSPQEKKSFWHRSPTGSTTSSYRRRSPIEPDPKEPFSISRESFDSYRRSFDISARSPITHSTSDIGPARRSYDALGRTSLDSHNINGNGVNCSKFTSPRTPKSPPMPATLSPRSTNISKFERASHLERALENPDGEEEPGFEDVKLADEQKPTTKKRGLGIWARFDNNNSENPNSPIHGSESKRSSIVDENSRPGSGHGVAARFHLPSMNLPLRKRGQSGQGAELGDITNMANGSGNGHAGNNSPAGKENMKGGSGSVSAAENEGAVR